MNSDVILFCTHILVPIVCYGVSLGSKRWHGNMCISCFKPFSGLISTCSMRPTSSSHQTLAAYVKYHEYRSHGISCADFAKISRRNSILLIKLYHERNFSKDTIFITSIIIWQQTLISHKHTCACFNNANINSLKANISTFTVFQNKLVMLRT